MSLTAWAEKHTIPIVSMPIQEMKKFHGKFKMVEIEAIFSLISLRMISMQFFFSIGGTYALLVSLTLNDCD